jgi:copper chaperone
LLDCVSGTGPAEGDTIMVDSTYTVQGMTCGHCVVSVAEEVSKIAGVSDVRVDLASGRVVITSDQPVTDAAVTEAVEEAGYQIAVG